MRGEYTRSNRVIASEENGGVKKKQKKKGRIYE